MTNFKGFKYIEGKGYIRESTKRLVRNVNEGFGDNVGPKTYESLINFGQNFIALGDKRASNPEEYINDVRELLNNNIDALSWDVVRPSIKKRNRFDRGYADDVYMGDRALSRLSLVFPHLIVAKYLNVLRKTERMPFKLSYYKPISVIVDGKKYNGQVRVSTHEAIPAFFANETNKKFGDNNINFAISVVVKPTFPFGKKAIKNASGDTPNNVQVVEFINSSIGQQESYRMAEELSKKISWLSSDSFDISSAIQSITDKNILSGDFLKQYLAKNGTLYTYNGRSNIDPVVANIKTRINKYLETNLPFIGKDTARQFRSSMDRCTTPDEALSQEKVIKHEVRLLKKQKPQEVEEEPPVNTNPFEGIKSITYEQALEMFRNKGSKFQLGFKINFFNGTSGKCFGQLGVVSTINGAIKLKEGTIELCTYKIDGKPKNAGYRGLSGVEQVAYFINKVNNGYTPCLDKDTSRRLQTTIFFRNDTPLFIYDAEGQAGQQFIMINSLNESLTRKKVILTEEQLRGYIKYVKERLL